MRPGLEPGTTGLILDVQDRLPLHGRLEWDNYSPPGTPELRVNANASYDNLWQLNHSLGLQYGFSPDLMKPSLDGAHLPLNPLDSPNVTYYSGFYRAPLGPPESMESQIGRDPNHFGYNETTKQFVLPPTTGRPEFSSVFLPFNHRAYDARAGNSGFRSNQFDHQQQTTHHSAVHFTNNGWRQIQFSFTAVGPNPIKLEHRHGLQAG